MVRTVRREGLDHLLVPSRHHLERVLHEYVLHYNQARPHRGLDLAVPQPRPALEHGGPVRRHDVLGGIIHEYQRAASDRRAAPRPTTRHVVKASEAVGAIMGSCHLAFADAGRHAGESSGYASPGRG